MSIGAPDYPYIVVVQSDRDAALECGRHWARWTPRQIEMVEQGEGDGSPLVQAFARYRLSLAPIETEDQGAKRGYEAWRAKKDASFAPIDAGTGETARGLDGEAAKAGTASKSIRVVERNL